MNTKETKQEFKIRRAANRRDKNKARNNRVKSRWRYCDSCGGREQWCSCCKVWTKTCCVDYGTCMCS